MSGGEVGAVWGDLEGGLRVGRGGAEVLEGDG